VQSIVRLPDSVMSIQASMMPEFPTAQYCDVSHRQSSYQCFLCSDAGRVRAAARAVSFKRQCILALYIGTNQPASRTRSKFRVNTAATQPACCLDVQFSLRGSPCFCYATASASESTSKGSPFQIATNAPDLGSGRCRTWEVISAHGRKWHRQTLLGSWK
jgi:hypothetical protein